jgi:hypothetical protein
MKAIYKIIFLLFLIPSVIFGNDDKKHEKSKTIQKEFPIHSDGKVTINNRYGKISVMTWNENRVVFEVKITVKGSDLREVQKSFSSIDVAFNSSASMVEATTIFEKKRSSWSWWGKNSTINYEIDYIVKMPQSNQVDLTNDYGGIYLDKIDGEATINCDYGKITIGRLNNSTNTINLDYCASSTISFMKEGFVNIDYSKLHIENAGDIKLKADYSTSFFGTLNGLDFNTDYGAISIDDVHQVHGNTEYTTMTFGTVRENLKIDTEYGSIFIDHLANGFKNVEISAQYAGIIIGTSKSNNFSFDLDLEYGSFRKDQEQVTISKSIEKTTKKYYEGIFGKGNAQSQIKIKSQYGSVTFKGN